MDTALINYYKDRAAEYEKIYHKAERQTDLTDAALALQSIFSGKEILEIACGTGYWTEKLSVTAREILATDINETVIDIAKTKNYSPASVRFQTTDLYQLPHSSLYESLFGGFIWSHIALRELPHFINVVNKLVHKDGTVVFMDNNYVEGSNLPITDRDEEGNTYQTRLLENGTSHKVLKNFPTEGFIRDLLKEKASRVEFISLQYYWILKYRAFSI